MSSGVMPITKPNVHVRVASGTHVGRVRAANEDAYVVLDLDGGREIGGGSLARVDLGARGLLLAVADGMGGARDGALASSVAIATLAQALNAASSIVDPTAALEHASYEAHRAVWDESVRQGHEGHTRMGTTLTAALVRGHTLSIAQVGDSRAYLVRQGDMTQLTNDQTMVQSLVDKGLMKPEDADNSPFKNILSQAMGHQETIEIKMSELELADRDLLLVCSDGLTGEISEDEIKDIMLTSLRLDIATKRLIDMSNARGGRDNITVVLGGVGVAE
jgi:serine/threonine protein phosphatase PrpC